jgi:uncharacterized membrane protein
MTKNRLEAFSDGVMAIIITIMVLELKVPHGAGLNNLLPLLPVFLSYILSFIYVGIYWNNHHHLFHTVKNVSGGILWANLHLLFWLSLFPFVTGWMGENNFALLPTAVYGAVLMMAGTAYFVLEIIIIKQQGENSILAKALGNDFKGKTSILLYLTAIASVFINPLISQFIYAIVAMIWTIPDKRIERILFENSPDN